MINEMRGGMANLYNVFVDWEGRLSREMPGLTKALDGCNRVLDVGCGTGRHVQALLDAGFDAHGADASEEMLSQAVEFTNQPDRFTQWRLGTAAPALEPFDAVIAMGNVWPQLKEEHDIDTALLDIRALLRPKGKVVMGMKALEAMREAGNPYMPLLKREHEGEPIWFIRYIDFTVEKPFAGMHMVVVKGEDEQVSHRTGVTRSWSATELRERFEAAGFQNVAVSGKLGEPNEPATGPDVFLHATT